jgi:hypothetical protein
MKNSLNVVILGLVVILMNSVVQAQTVTQQAPVPVGPGVFAPGPGQFQDPINVPGNPGQTRSGSQTPGAQHWPQYQYPQHNNPYYDGGTPGAMVSDTVDWLMALPSNLMDRFSEYMDTKFFPAKPATSGSPAPRQGAANPSGAPLPPANAYNPDRK